MVELCIIKVAEINNNGRVENFVSNVIVKLIQVLLLYIIIYRKNNSQR